MLPLLGSWKKVNMYSFIFKSCQCGPMPLSWPLNTVIYGVVLLYYAPIFLSTILNNNIDCFCRREKEAFEKLISEKSGMVIPEDREGKDSMVIPKDREGKDSMVIPKDREYKCFPTTYANLKLYLSWEL